jgi:hypothetical protein
MYNIIWRNIYIFSKSRVLLLFIITGSTANLKKVLKANMEDSSQKMKVVNGQPALKTKGTNSVKEQLGAKTSKKKRTKKPSMNSSAVTIYLNNEIFLSE